jgi:hypothetical protein
MAVNKPNPKSYEQILSEMIDAYLSKIGINDLNVGGAMLSFMEADAQTVYRALAENFSYLRDSSVDNASGEALRRIAADENVKIQTAKVATGKVTIRDTSFEKIATKIYAGASAPNIGTTTLKVSDASLFPSSGVIYIGRGTPNVEGPLPFVSVTQVGSFYEITLSSPTTKFHNISESVILGQGGVRNIPAGSIVRSPASGGSSSIDFSVTQSAILLDGENIVTGIGVAALEPGSQGNVPRGAIKEVGTPLFTGAAVSNDQAFVTGKDEDSDSEIRDNIKRARLSKGLGTALAIKNATLGIQPSDENARVISNEILSDAEQTTLYIDDGSGYEAKSRGIGLEFIVDSALGGEDRFQLATGGRQTSVVKAYLEATLTQPYAVSEGNRLALLVGGVLSEHVFESGAFRSNGFATAYEVVASINSNPTLSFVAKTSGNGTKVVLEAKSEDNEFLRITEPTTGNDAAIAMGFSSSEVETLKLYKNRRKLSRNGRVAQVESENQTDWANTITSGDTLILSVDGTQAITHTFTSADFIAEGTYSSVSKNNSLQSWINVVNAKVTGASASINGSRIILSSNLGSNSRASIVIDPLSTLVLKGMFSSQMGLEANGFEADFILSRNTAQFKLLQPLQEGDSLTAGTEFTRAEIQSEPVLGGSTTLTGDALLWFLIDNKEAEIVQSSFVQDTLVTINKQGSDVIRYTSSVANATSNVQIGDYVIIWSEEFNANNRFEARVFDVGSDWFEIKVTSAEYAAASNEVLVSFEAGIVFVRTAYAPQKLKFPIGTYNIASVAADIESNLTGVIASTLDDEIIVITSKAQDDSGAILLVAQNVPAKNFNFTEGQRAESSESQFAFYASETEEAEFPLFVHGTITQDESANPPDTTIPSFESSVDLDALNVEPNALVEMIHSYLTNSQYVSDAQADNEYTQLESYSPTTAFISPNQRIKRLRVGDRYFLAQPLDFDYNDLFVAILDGRPQDQTFPVPLYRRATVNGTAPISTNNFRAYDVDSGASVLFQDFFTPSFDFSNYKVMMRARNVIDPSSGLDEDAIIFRASAWGTSGEKYKVGYNYPTSANQGITHTIVNEDRVNVRIFLQSGIEVGNQIDGTTEWDVTVTPNTPVAGVDQVTYTWSGVGTDPQMTTLSPDHYVTINEQGEFSKGNTGTYKIIIASPTSFTVQMPSGQAVPENAVATLTNTTISLYENEDTTAEEIVDYVNTNLSDFLSAELVDDNGTTGAGVIGISTYEDSDFTEELVSLVDGINWISYSNLSAAAPSAEFVFKRPLQLASFSTNTVNAYSFNAGEEIRFVPTTIAQVSAFLNVLAVSGVSTLSNLNTSLRDGKLQITTNTLGSQGSVLITGGTANQSLAQIIGQSNKIIGFDLVAAVVARSQGAGFHGDQWVKISNENTQKKIAGISDATNVYIAPNLPVAGKSIITLANRENQDLYFGQSHPSFRDLGRAFHVEKHGKLVCISWDGITGTNPYFAKSVDINADGGNIEVDFDEFRGLTSYIVTSGTRNFAEVQVGDTLTVANMADSANNGIFPIVGISDDKMTLVVENTNGVDAAPAAVAIGDFTISHEIKEGDVVEVREPFSPLNQGKFTIIRRFENSIYIDNPNAQEERVVISSNLRSLGFDLTTEVDVTVNGDMRIEWTRVGTQPTFENARMGDLITLGASFSVANQGTFMVTNSQVPLKETTLLRAAPANDITGGQYFFIALPNSGTEYYVWFDKDNSSVDPAVVGKTGIEVDISTGDSATTVALNLAVALNAIVGFSASSSADLVTVTCDDFGPALDAENVNLPSNFIVTISQQGENGYIELANANAVQELGLDNIPSSDMECHISSMIFTNYEATKFGDLFSIAGDVLGTNNQGSYVVLEVISKSKIIVQGSLNLANDVSLAGAFDQIYIEEEKPYVGYKKIHTTLVDPANPQRFLIVFDSANQFLKINSTGGSVITSIGKINFPTQAKSGIDAYRYHTGLIAEANRVIYGDPRDNTTYPGVSAAGAEIFTREPLPRRIQVSINVRVNTGVPFVRVVEQVRNNIAALINATGIGQSIAISDIISSVNSIQGVRAVSISSPLYSPASDVIAVNASEKPIVVDIVNDISVSKVGA